MRVIAGRFKALLLLRGIFSVIVLCIGKLTLLQVIVRELRFVLLSVNAFIILFLKTFDISALLK